RAARTLSSISPPQPSPNSTYGPACTYGSQPRPQRSTSTPTHSSGQYQGQAAPPSELPSSLLWQRDTPDGVQQLSQFSNTRPIRRDAPNVATSAYRRSAD